MSRSYYLQIMFINIIDANSSQPVISNSESKDALIGETASSCVLHY